MCLTDGFKFSPELLSFYEFGSQLFAKASHKYTRATRKTRWILRHDILGVNPRGGWEDVSKEDHQHFVKYSGLIEQLVSVAKLQGHLSIPENFLSRANEFQLDVPPLEDFRVVLDWLIQCFEISLKKTQYFDRDDLIFMPLYMDLEIPQHKEVYVYVQDALQPIHFLLINKLLGGSGRKSLVEPTKAPKGKAVISTKLDTTTYPTWLLDTGKILPLPPPPEVTETVSWNTFIDTVNTTDLVLSEDYGLLFKARSLLEPSGFNIGFSRTDSELIDDVAGLLDKISAGGIFNLSPLGIKEYIRVETEHLADHNQHFQAKRLKVLATLFNTFPAQHQGKSNLMKAVQQVFSICKQDVAITLSSIFKADELEADRVFILGPTKVQGCWARKELYYVETEE